MSVFLIVRVLDVTYTPHAAQTVKAGFNGSALAPVPAVSPTGSFEIPIPTGTTRLAIHLDSTGFWPVDQNLILNAGPPPTLSFDGAQVVNVRNLDAHTRGTDFNVEVFVVLGQLKDMAADINAIAAGASISLALTAHSVPRISTPILNPAGAGFGRINASSATVLPAGTIFFVRRVQAPKLIAIYRPPAFATHPTVNPQNSPLDYHLFFHPSIPGDFPRNYPDDPSYADLIFRYVLAPLFTGGGIDPSGKQMAHQHEAINQKSIFIFPVGSPVAQMGTLNTQANTLRLLQEVGYWIQRMDGVPFPLQPVGKLAMSCFSAGIRFLGAILMGRKLPSFFDTTLKEIYSFDGVFAPAIRKRMTPEQIQAANAVARRETSSFNRTLLAWWRSGADTRSFRIYTQSGSYWDDLHSAVGTATVTNGHNASRESENARSTILHTPTAFWTAINPAMDYGFVHQFIPAFFMEHAISLIGF